VIGTKLSAPTRGVVEKFRVSMTSSSLRQLFFFQWKNRCEQKNGGEQNQQLQQLVKKIEATEAAADSFVQKGTIEEKIGSPLENIAKDVAKETNDSENLVISVPRVTEADTEAIGKIVKVSIPS